jgi:predicted NBD/HSP70 family sugar kinase
MLDELVEHLAAGLVSLVNLLSPELIVVGGYLAEAGEQLLEPLREALRTRAFPMLRTSIRIEATSFGKDAGAVGAATVALDTLFYEPQLRTRTLEPKPATRGAFAAPVSSR